MVPLQLVDALEWCSELGVSHISAFAFGVENFKRTAEEIETIMQLAEEKLRALAQVGFSVSQPVIGDDCT